MGENVNELLEVESKTQPKENLHSTKNEVLFSIEGEEVLLNVNNKQLILTTHRIRQENYSSTGALISMTSIMLEKICSCSLTTKRRIVLLILGIVIGGILIASGNATHQGGGIAPLGGLIFIGFIILYFYLKDKIISFRSAGDAIKVSLSGISLEEIKKIIDKVEVAKNNRYRHEK